MMAVAFVSVCLLACRSSREFGKKDFRLFVISGQSGVEEGGSHCLDYACWNISYVTQKQNLFVCVPTYYGIELC